MGRAKFEPNIAGITELRKSAEMKAVLNHYASVISSTAGAGYETVEIMSGDRAKVFVVADTAEARKDNLENNTLLKALRGSA